MIVTKSLTRRFSAHRRATCNVPPTSQERTQSRVQQPPCSTPLQQQQPDSRQQVNCISKATNSQPTNCGGPTHRPINAQSRPLFPFPFVAVTSHFSNHTLQAAKLLFNHYRLSSLCKKAPTMPDRPPSDSKHHGPLRPTTAAS